MLRATRRAPRTNPLTVPPYVFNRDFVSDIALGNQSTFMAKLSKEQIAFLKEQGISPSQVFDASLVKSKLEVQKQMKELELSFYFGQSACRIGGHTLKTRAGHCIQCHTSKIAYQLRSSASGYVYLAYSQSKKLAKVGFTKNPPKERAELLSREQYATAADWEIRKLVKFDKDAGKKEFAIHSRLEGYLKPVAYEKYKGQMVECREVFNCPLEVAAKVFDEVTRP